MNAFERHGIEHLSPSAINAWINSPSLFVLERLMGFKGQMGASAHRGTATEVGVSAGLFEPAMPLSACVATALPVYDRLTALSGDPKRDSERAAIPGMVAQGLALRERGRPIVPNEEGRFKDVAPQHKIEISLEGVPVPVIGYLDFLYDDCLVDLKSTLRAPSEMSEPHLRQASVYKKFHRDRRVHFFYVSDKKSALHTLTRDQYDVAMRELIGASKRLERFLGLSDDVQELAAIVPHSSESFYFNDPGTKAKALEVFGY